MVPFFGCLTWSREGSLKCGVQFPKESYKQLFALKLWYYLSLAFVARILLD